MRHINWKPPASTLIIGLVVGYCLNVFFENKQTTEQLSSTSVFETNALENVNTYSPPLTSETDNQVKAETLLDIAASTNILEQIGENTETDNLAKWQYISDYFVNVPEFDHESISRNEVEAFEEKILQQLDNHPDQANSLLDLYADLSEGIKKDSVRSMLAASELTVVEDRAITELLNYDPSTQYQWLDVLSSTGIKKSENRDTLFSIIHSIEDSDTIATALYAFSPSLVDEYQRAGIVNELGYFLINENPIVKATAVEVMSRWVNKGNSRFLEEAILDESIDVRFAALSSAYVSGIKSAQLKEEMLNILQDDVEPFSLRLKAFNALSTYPLDEFDSDLLYQFSIQNESLGSTNDATKG